MSTWVGQAMQWNQLETLNSKFREGTGSGRVSLVPNISQHPSPFLGHGPCPIYALNELINAVSKKLCNLVD